MYMNVCSYNPSYRANCHARSACCCIEVIQSPQFHMRVSHTFQHEGGQGKSHALDFLLYRTVYCTSRPRELEKDQNQTPRAHDISLFVFIHPSPKPTGHLSLGLEGSGETLHVLLEVAVLGEELDVGTVDLDLTSLALGNVLVAAERGETPVLGDDDLLATRELVLRAAESLNSSGTVCNALGQT